jgi:predicted Zn-dependent protease
VGLVTGSDRLTQIAGRAAEYFTLRYSRKQEFESDDIGIRYLAEAGYDPYAAADMLGALGRQEQYMAETGGRDAARGIPEWARTHPLTENRIERALEQARATGVAPDALPERKGEYLREVDGLLYGDDPQQGFVVGRRFAHPVMRIGFEAPKGFTLTNSPQAILVEGPEGVRGEFGGGRMPAGGLDAYATALVQQLFGNAQAEIGAVERSAVNGLPTILVPVQVATEQGALQVTIAAYGAAADSAYHFIMVSTPGSGKAPLLGALFRSFHILTPDEVARLRPREIDVVTVGAGESLRTLAARMASDHPLQTLLMLNGRTADRPVVPGERVKLIAYRR